MITKQKSLGRYLGKVCTIGDMTTKINGKTITLTSSEVHEMVHAYLNELQTTEGTTTIDSTIASLYKEYGYIVKAEGIGWKIKRSI